MKRGALSLLIGTFVLVFLNSTSAAPPVPRSVHYDGTSAQVQSYAYRPLMNTNVAMTVEAWVYREDSSRCETILSHDYRNSFWLGFCPRLRFYRSGGASADATQDVPSNQWTHVAASYDGTRVRFYINGVAAGNLLLSNGGVGANNTMHIGGVPEVNNYYFRGNLDEVRLWNVARTQSQIQSNMFVQLINSSSNNIPELTASFNLGGGTETYRGWSGTTALLPSRISGFGILPSNLVIPRAPSFNFDGRPETNFEFAGAEQIVLRYNDGANAPDGIVYLAYRDAGTNRYLYFGTSNLRPPISPSWEDSSLTIYIDPNNSRSATRQNGDFQISTTTGAGSGSGFVYSSPIFGLYPQHGSNWQYIANFCEGEFAPPCQEIRIHASDFGSFSNNIGLFFTHGPNTNATDFAEWPGNGLATSPATYAEARFGGNADANVGSVSVSGMVTNTLTGGGISNQVVRLYSGDSSLTGIFVAQTTTTASGAYSFSNVPIIADQQITLTLEAVPGNSYLEPQWGAVSGANPIATNNNVEIRYPVCAFCTLRSINFRVVPPPGAMRLDSFSPTTAARSVTLRTSPLKVRPGDLVRIHGSNIHNNIQVFFSRCSLTPPDSCIGRSDFIEAQVTATSPARLWAEVRVPEVQRSLPYQVVVRDNLIGHPGWTEWKYMPGAAGSFVGTDPIYPLLHSFEFINRDDGPSYEEFEAIYGRDLSPQAGIWFIVYMIWMDGTRGSCFGMAGTSRLFANGLLPISTYDRAGSDDGFHGVRFANGFVGDPPPCDGFPDPCPNKPQRWTGFDLFQPFRPANLWAHITTMAGAQTSAEALANSLSQLRRPVNFGPRRGFAAGDPVAVLNRLRANPTGYTLCVQKRDFGDGHCVTPYAVVDDMALDAIGLNPVPSANYSLIKIYDNNAPEEERFIEINRVDNTYRYNSQGRAETYIGPGLFSVPISIYRGPRHIPGPVFLAEYGLDFLRILTVGASSSSMTDASGGRVGWNGNQFTNGYEGALPFSPVGFLPDDTNKLDVPMLFLPASNAPIAGGFFSSGSNVLVYGGMGGGDIAFGFNAPNTGASNGVDGILIGLSQGLRAMGFRAGAPVNSFGAMVSTRDDTGKSRLFVIDAGAGALTPDIHIERDGIKSLTLRNRSAAPFGFRMNVVGADPTAGNFDHAYEFYNQPPNSTLTLRLPENPSSRIITRELDANNDGTPETTDDAPANGQLRIGNDAGLLALRWRQAGRGDVLECTSNLNSAVWAPVNASITTTGADNVARVNPSGPSQFYRVRPMGSNCLSLSAFALGARPNPWETNGFKFEALSADRAMLPQNMIATRGGFTGLDVVHTMRVHPMDDCEVIHIEVFQTSGLVTFDAVGPLGAVVARETLTGVGTGPQRVTLRSFRGRIDYVRVISPNALCLILNVCCERAQRLVRTDSHCLSFSNATAGQFSSPYTFAEVVITATPGPVIVGPVFGLDGNWLKLSGQIELKLLAPAAPCDRVALYLRDFEGVVTATAYNSAGAVVATAGPPPGSDTPQDLIVSGPGITRVVLSSTSDKAFLQGVCCDRTVGP